MRDSFLLFPFSSVSNVGCYCTWLCEGRISRLAVSSNNTVQWGIFCFRQGQSWNLLLFQVCDDTIPLLDDRPDYGIGIYAAMLGNGRHYCSFVWIWKLDLKLLSSMLQSLFIVLLTQKLCWLVHLALSYGRVNSFAYEQNGVEKYFWRLCFVILIAVTFLPALQAICTLQLVSWK